VRHVIIPVTLRHECVQDPVHNGKPSLLHSHPDVDGALAVAVKEKLDAYQRNFFFCRRS